jgi:ribosome biogenesis protein NSA2
LPAGRLPRTFINSIKSHEEKEQTSSAPSTSRDSAVPAYLLDREQQTHGKLLSNMIKQKRKEKAGKWEVPINKVKAISDAEAFKVG